MPAPGGQQQMCRRAAIAFYPPRPLLLLVLVLVLVLLLPAQSHVLAPPSSPSSSSSSSSSSFSSSAASGRPPLHPRRPGPPRNTQDLGRLLKEQELRALAKQEAAAQALLESETEVDAAGVRRPRDRRLSFTPSSSSSFCMEETREATEDSDKVGARKGDSASRVAPAAAGDEHVAPAVDGQLLRQAYQARKARVEELSQFRSRRGKQSRNNHVKSSLSSTTTTMPTTTTTTMLLLLRIKFPDGALLTARFHEEERVADVFALLRTALSLAPSSDPSHPPSLPPLFTLLNLGGMGPRRLSSKQEKRKPEKTMNLTLKACGLTAPAATLLLQWQKDAAFPKDTAEWIDWALLQPSATGEE